MGSLSAERPPPPSGSLGAAGPRGPREPLHEGAGQATCTPGRNPSSLKMPEKQLQVGAQREGPPTAEGAGGRPAGPGFRNCGPLPLPPLTRKPQDHTSGGSLPKCVTSAREAVSTWPCCWWLLELAPWGLKRHGSRQCLCERMSPPTGHSLGTGEGPALSAGARARPSGRPRWREPQEQLRQRATSWGPVATLPVSTLSSSVVLQGGQGSCGLSPTLRSRVSSAPQAGDEGHLRWGCGLSHTRSLGGWQGSRWL